LYLDGSGLEQTEDIGLSGTTEVMTTATDISFVQDIHSLEVGTSLSADGAISIYRSGNTATEYDLILSGGNMSTTCAKQVPINKNLFLTRWSATAMNNKRVTVRLRATAYNGIPLTGSNDDPIFLFKDTCRLQNSVYVHEFTPPMLIPSGTYLKTTAWTTQNNAYVSSWFEGFFITM